MHHAVPMRGAVLVPLNIRLSDPGADLHPRALGQRRCWCWATRARRSRRARSRAGARDPGARAGPDGDYERLLARARAGRRPVRRRARPARHQLHERDHRPAQGRDDPPPRRLPAEPVAARARPDGPGLRVPLDRCRCSTATAGASPGGSRRSAGRTSASAGSTRRTIWRLLRDEGVTHFSAAPTVLTMIAAADGGGRSAAGAHGSGADRRRPSVADPAGPDGPARAWTSPTCTG